MKSVKASLIGIGLFAIVFANAGIGPKLPRENAFFIDTNNKLYSMVFFYLSYF